MRATYDFLIPLFRLLRLLAKTIVLTTMNTSESTVINNLDACSYVSHISSMSFVNELVVVNEYMKYLTALFVAIPYGGTLMSLPNVTEELQGLLTDLAEDQNIRRRLEIRMDGRRS